MAQDDVYHVIMDSLRIVLADRLARETVIVEGLHCAYEIVNNQADFQQVFDLLEDDYSRRTLSWFLKFRIANYLTTSKNEAQRLFPPVISSSRHSALALKSREIPEASLEGNLEFDVIENFLLDGYNLPGKCEVEPGDTVLDFGAYNGNSSIVFSRLVGDAGRVLAFEPNPNIRGVLALNLSRESASNVEIVALGVGDVAGTFGFVEAGPASHIALHSSMSIEITTIDDYVFSSSFASVDFMKFDIEGHELNAIRKARKTIVHYRPKMAISVYHLHNDINEITLLIRDMCPWYRFYLRHNATFDTEVVLFCSPIGR